MAICCIHVPMSETPCPTTKRRKLRCDSARSIGRTRFHARIKTGPPLSLILRIAFLFVRPPIHRSAGRPQWQCRPQEKPYCREPRLRIFGLRQLRASHSDFRILRFPTYLCFFGLVWLIPPATLARPLLIVLCAGYILLGSSLKVRAHGASESNSVLVAPRRIGA